MIRKKKIAQIILIVLIILLVVPFLMNILWAVPESDDFTQYSLKSTTLAGAFNTANNTYMKWNGCWSYNFVYYIFHPLKYYEPGSHSVGIAIGFQFILLIIAVVGLVFCFADHFLSVKDTAIKLLISFIVLVMVLNSHIFGEIFGWYVGSKYMGAIILEIVCLLLEKRYIKHNGLLAGVLLSIVGFMACMIVNVAVPIGSIYLILLYDRYRREKPDPGRLFIYLIPFFFCVAGGLVYVLSPGNFIRQSRIDSTGMHPFRGLIYTAIDIGIYTADLCFNYIVVFGLLASLVLAVVLTRKKIFREEYVQPVIPFLLSYAISFLLVYPAATGYGDIELPNRIMFLLYVNLILGLMYSFLNLGVFIEVRFGSRISKREILYGVILLLLGFYCTAGDRAYIANTPYVRQVLDYKKTVEYNRAWADVFTQIIESDEEDVVIDGSKKYLKSGLLDYPCIEEDPEYYVNKAASRFFGKNSISVMYGDD